MANMTRWNPVREMAAMQNLMDRMLDDFVRGNAEITGAALALDVHEDEKQYVVSTALPGVKAEDITISLHDDFLTIEAEIPARQTRSENARVLLQERSYGKFNRRIRLPQPVNQDNVEATYEDGVLTLTLAKAENALPRNIPVRTRHSNN